ncbi:hypothetical protein JCM5350_008173 [Sporobolomyces pararoseus]
MNAYKVLAERASDFLQHPAFADLDFSPCGVTLPDIPLVLPSPTCRLEKELTSLRCSPEAVLALKRVLNQACTRLEEVSRRALRESVQELEGVAEAGDTRWLVEYLLKIAARISSKYSAAVTTIEDRILEEVIEATARYSASSSKPLPPSLHESFAYPLPSPPLEPAGTFTEEVVAILQKAFETSENLTRAEVKGLMQIRTWFANARQRRGRKAAPYDTPRRPGQASKQAKSRSTNPPLRNVSNSSSSSDSSNSSFSSLVSYASTLATEISLPDQLNVSPIQLERSHSFSQASSKEEEEDVPMDLSTLDPPPSHFPRSLSLPSETGPFPKVPPAPSTAETDQFFSLQQSQPPSHHPTLNPASQFFDVQYSQATETTTMNESNPNDLGLSFLSQIQETDPFLDDQFLQNVFGTLGVTQGGGLTLSMDSFREEQEEEMGGEGGGGMMVEFAARGENGEGVSFCW